MESRWFGWFPPGSAALSPQCTVAIDSVAVAAWNNSHYESQATQTDFISGTFQVDSSYYGVECVGGQRLTCKPFAACMAACVSQLIYNCQHLSCELRHAIHVSGLMSHTSCFLHHNLFLALMEAFALQQEHDLNYFCSDSFVLSTCEELL